MQFSFPATATPVTKVDALECTTETSYFQQYSTLAKPKPVSTSPAATVPNSDGGSDEYLEYDSDFSSFSESTSTSDNSLQHREVKKMKMEAEHKPARGRQRKQQLMKMTEEEREIEREILMEKSRQSARDCRKRKKSNIDNLKAQLEHYERQHAEDVLAVTVLRKENAVMQHQLKLLQKYVTETQRKRV